MFVGYGGSSSGDDEDTEGRGCCDLAPTCREWQAGEGVTGEGLGPGGEGEWLVPATLLRQENDRLERDLRLPSTRPLFFPALSTPSLLPQVLQGAQ